MSRGLDPRDVPATLVERLARLLAAAIEREQQRKSRTRETRKVG